jgi:lipopolysaccharide export system permease protein
MPPYLREFKRVRDSINRYRYMPKEIRAKADARAEKGAARPSVNPVVKAERSLTDRIRDNAVKRRTSTAGSEVVANPIDSSSEVIPDSLFLARLDSLYALQATRDVVQSATNMARQVKSQVMNSNAAIENYQKEKIVFEIQWHKIIASSFMCIAMFLIGAPLGAIIKRGGLGVPFLISILFFIVYYVLNMQGEKMAKQGLISPMVGIWAADFILLIIGFIFLRQARVDARLFDADAYRVLLDRLNKWFASRRFQSKPAT